MASPLPFSNSILITYKEEIQELKKVKGQASPVLTTSHFLRWQTMEGDKEKIMAILSSKEGNESPAMLAPLVQRAGSQG